MSYSFSQHDLDQFSSLEISPDEVEKQLERFKKGFPFLNILKPARVKDGILQLPDDEINEYIKLYEDSLNEIKVLKFVPASGAASRMFKSLYEFINTLNDSPDDILNLLVDRSFESVFYVINHINLFAFYEDLTKVLNRKSLNLEKMLEQSDYGPIIKAILNEDGLNYGNLPKGLLKFHKYPDFTRTSAEEHIVEGANCCKSGDSVVRVHFTVSPEHLAGFHKHIEQIKPRYEKQFKIKLEISFSVQKKSTDTLAVDLENNPFRNTDGTLLFRPAGHGALLENLQELDAELIFIKNIDNIVPDRLKDLTIRYKKAIGGILLAFQYKIFDYLEKFDKTSQWTDDEFDTLEHFVINELFVHPASEYSNLQRDDKLKFLYQKLNRPIRVCGMVKNEGEPGGGPFWAKNEDGSVSLQIVESSQIDFSIPEKLSIFTKSTHFNPVDLVISTRNYKGDTFKLTDFRDDNTGFISTKSKDGRSLKAMEIPGLWNGAMSDWNTIFLEVPLLTFNPVKIINDLLREEHANLENLSH
jgi:hypothetical protein